MSASAFKEWNVIVEALGAGEQIIILRKGGISEGRGGFQVKANRFWLFPTQFHAQREKTKPDAAKWFRETSDAATVRLEYFAEIAEQSFLSDWEKIEALDPFHFWSEETIRERYDWSKPPGIHLLIVRIFRRESPLIMPLTPAMAGCKSWIETLADLDESPSRPVLMDAAFETKRSRVVSALVGITKT